MNELTRRGFIKGVAGIIAASAAPAIILKPGVLMKVRPIWVPEWPMREIFAYDISTDSYMVRYDALVGKEQLHVSVILSTREFVEGKLFPQVDARKALAKYAANQGIDLRKAVPLPLPQGCEHARILT